MTEVNVPLLRKAVEWVESEVAKPWEIREWDQEDWVSDSHRDPEFRQYAESKDLNIKAAHCGTAYCVAGYIAQLHNPVFEKNEMALIDGNRVHSSDYAARLLGLDDQQAHRLFYGGNSAERVREVAEELAGERL